MIGAEESRSNVGDKKKVKRSVKVAMKSEQTNIDVNGRKKVARTIHGDVAFNTSQKRMITNSYAELGS